MFYHFLYDFNVKWYYPYIILGCSNQLRLGCLKTSALHAEFQIKFCQRNFETGQRQRWAVTNARLANATSVTRSLIGRGFINSWPHIRILRFCHSHRVNCQKTWCNLKLLWFVKYIIYNFFPSSVYNFFEWVEQLCSYVTGHWCNWNMVCLLFPPKVMHTLLAPPPVADSFGLYR